MKRIILIFMLLSSVLMAAIVNEVEPNNKDNDATAITISDIGNGNLGNYIFRKINKKGKYVYDKDIVDWWTFTPNKSGILKIYTTNSRKDMDAEIYKKNQYLTNDTSYDNNIELILYVEKGKTYNLKLYFDEYYSYDWVKRIKFDVDQGLIVNNTYDDWFTNYQLHFEFIESPDLDGVNTRDFTPAFNKNLHGALRVIGNHNLCKKVNGECVAPLDSDSNNQVYQYYINVDDEAVNNGYINSSESDLQLNNGDEVIWAGLYWQGRIRTNDPNNDNRVRLAKYVEFKTPTSNGYVQIESNSTKFNWYYGSDGVFDYSGMADVTDLVKESGQYFVANLQVSEGYNTGGGWSLVVVTRNPSDKFRKIVVYDGFQAVYNSSGYPSSVTQTLSGFYTPPSGDISASFILFANETDRALVDYITITDKNGNEHYLQNRLNPYNNVLNATISKFGQNVLTRNPNYENTLATDIDEFDIGDILDNSQTETEIKITSGGDRIFLDMFGISIELYVPKVCYDNLKYYDENNQLIESGTQISSGSKIRVEFEVKNMGDEIAKNVIVRKFFDDNVTSYERNSTYVKDVLETQMIHIPDNSSVNDINVTYLEDKKLWAVGILGDDNDEFKPTKSNPDYVAKIDFNVSVENEGNITMNFLTTYIYEIANEEYSYEDYLPKCSDFNDELSSYNPEAGTFNVVESSFNSSIDPTDVNNSLNKILTKVTAKPTTMKVISLDTDKETLKKYSGLLEVDLIKEPNSELECKNNETLDRYFVSFNNEKESLFEFNTTRTLKNSRFRVKYLVKNDGTYLDVACLATGSSNTNLGCVWGVLEQLWTDRGGNDCTTGQVQKDTCNAPCAEECSYYRLRNGQNEQDVVPSEDCLVCIFGNYSNSVCSRDNFAIRPDKFKINSISSKIKAGDEFNLTINALGADGNVAQDYNETLSLSVSPKLEIKDNNDTQCPTGNLYIIRNANFVNGVANVVLKYNEVGDTNLTVREYNNTNVYAKVDANDPGESEDDLFIKSDTTNIVFIPYKFFISGGFSDYKGGNFTYLANNLDMSAELNLQIEAKNKDNINTHNYSSQCYAKPIDINISYTLSSSLPPEVDTVYSKIYSIETNISVGSDLIITNIPKDIFNNGIARKLVKINLKRPYNKTVDPFEFNVTNVNINDSDNVEGNITLNQSAHFKYGKIMLNNVIVYNSNEANTTLQYLIWDGTNGWVVNSEHNETYYGDINKTAINSLLSALNIPVTVDIIPKSGKNILNGKETIKITTTHALPYSAKIHFDIPEWLWYHPLAKPYAPPSTSNLDCLTHPCMKVTFQKTGSGWAGIGNNESKYNENNKTVTTPLTKELNATKNEVKKLNW